jgi:hypothetical protein
MKLPRSGQGQLSLEIIELADHERPPMISLPEYLEKRRGAGVAEGVAGAGGAGSAAPLAEGPVQGETGPVAVLAVGSSTDSNA